MDILSVKFPNPTAEVVQNRIEMGTFCLPIWYYSSSWYFSSVKLVTQFFFILTDLNGLNTAHRDKTLVLM